LEDWIEEHGLPEGARGLIVKPIAETVLKPGVGVYTRPIIVQDSDAEGRLFNILSRWARPRPRRRSRLSSPPE